MNRNDQQTYNRIIALIVSISIILVMFFSLFYITSHIDHDCSHDNCPICAEIEMLQNLIRQVGSGIGACLILLCIFIPLIYKISVYIRNSIAITPISKKVRMNN